MTKLKRILCWLGWHEWERTGPLVKQFPEEWRFYAWHKCKRCPDINFREAPDARYL